VRTKGRGGTLALKFKNRGQARFGGRDERTVTGEKDTREGQSGCKPISETARTGLLNAERTGKIKLLVTKIKGKKKR